MPGLVHALLLCESTLSYELFQFFDLYILKPDFIAVILKKNITFCWITEIRPVFVFAVGNQRIPHVCITGIFDKFYPVQPVFYVVIFYNDSSCIELFLVERLFGGSRNQVV